MGIIEATKAYALEEEVPKKIFKPGDICQVEGTPLVLENEPDGLIVVKEYVSKVLAKYYGKLEEGYVRVIGLNTGASYSFPISKLNHCDRIRGIPQKVAPKKLGLGAQYSALAAATTKSTLLDSAVDTDEHPMRASKPCDPKHGGNACWNTDPKDNPEGWGCERLPGHLGYHMAWNDYPDALLENGQWGEPEPRPAQGEESHCKGPDSPPNSHGTSWSCERPKGHTGNHMAWVSWTERKLYEGGSWE